MEVITVFQDLAPGNHLWFQVEIGRIGTVVDHLRCPHTGGWLEIIGTDALATIEHLTGVDAQLRQVHRTGMADGCIRQTGDIGHILTLGGERDGYISLTATIFAGEHVTLCQSQVMRLGES